jgi:hypothetical protein
VFLDLIAKSGRVTARSTVQSIPVSDLQKDEVTQELYEFDNAKKEKIGKNIPESSHEDDEDLLAAIEDDGIDDSYKAFEQEAEKPEADSYSLRSSIIFSLLRYY